MMRYGGIFDVSGRRERLEEVERELAESDIWSDAPRAEVLARERAALEAVGTGLDRLFASSLSRIFGPTPLERKYWRENEQPSRLW